jgi:hypothetical protein
LLLQPEEIKNSFEQNQLKNCGLGKNKKMLKVESLKPENQKLEVQNCVSKVRFQKFNDQEFLSIEKDEKS